MKTTLLWGLTIALCACTNEQYAQFNKRVNDSISRTFGTQTEPPQPNEWKSETAIDYVAAPVQATAQKTAPVPAPKPKHPTAKRIDLVDGAIVCPSMNEAGWLFSQIDSARHARIALSPELRRQAALVNGYDEGEEPRPSDYGCVLVPAGTGLTVEPGNYVSVVSGKLPNGKRFKGVTLPNMVSH